MHACSFASVMSDSLWPYGLYPTRLLCPWDSPGKNAGMGCHALLQGTLPTQGSNPSLMSPALASGFFTLVSPGKLYLDCAYTKKLFIIYLKFNPKQTQLGISAVWVSKSMEPHLIPWKMGQAWWNGGQGPCLHGWGIHARPNLMAFNRLSPNLHKHCGLNSSVL